MLKLEVRRDELKVRSYEVRTGEVRSPSWASVVFKVLFSHTQNYPFILSNQNV